MLNYTKQRLSVIKKNSEKLLHTEKPSAVFIMTDPHRYDYLFEMEHEIRTMCPLLYYHVWDNDPVPNFLKSVYDSCDWIGCISKLTYENIKQLCPSHSGVEYIPHGVNFDIFQKQTDEQIIQNRKGFLGRDYKFVLFCNNVNTVEKNIASLIEGFSLFYRNLEKDEQSGVTLLIHTDPTSTNGPDLNCLLDDLYADIPVLISVDKVSDSHLNNIYNLSHCVINVATNEGFGLTTLESVATETPIIINNTGGLKDQYVESWSEKIEPITRILQGTQKTPYIYSDICSADDIHSAILKMYTRIKNQEIDMSSVKKHLHDNHFTTQQMCESIKNGLDKTISNVKSRPQYRFTKVSV